MKRTFGLTFSLSFPLVFGVVAVFAATPAAAAPTLRHKVDQRGDFVLIGNTLGHDCDAGVLAPVTGTIGACGTNTGDTSPDVFWRADAPINGQARADFLLPGSEARSTAVLAIPAGATITYARLYWAATRSGMTNDTTALVDRVGTGAFSQMVTADASSNVTTTTGDMATYYQSTADVTTLVRANGPGAYRISGVDSVDVRNVDRSRGFVAWSMVVLYQLDTEAPRNLTIFDGLDVVDPDASAQAVDIPLSGFLVPNAGFTAKLGIVAYEGDDSIDGDSLFFNPTTFPAALTDALNPGDDFFNGTRSTLGGATSLVGDLPRLSGQAHSMSGVDIDVVDVSSRLGQGNTTANIRVASTGDLIVTGVFVTSISTFKPDFTSTMKSWVNTTRNDGTVRAGDVLQYTVVTTNEGNDPGVGVVLRDAIPTGLSYVPGTISITGGSNTGAKTDVADADQGEYDAGTRTVVVRLGTGANGTMGGRMAAGASATVVFRVSVDAAASGTIANQAVLSAGGEAGAPMATYPSDGNGLEPGTPPTSTPIDTCTMDSDCPMGVCKMGPHPWACVECKVNADCKAADKPVCDTMLNKCRACGADSECGGATPACHPSGRCSECSATLKTACVGAKPLCNEAMGVCFGCATNADCSGTTPVCDMTSKACRACAADAECPMATPACLTTGACGECSMTSTAKCVAPKPACDTAANVCVACLTNANCAAPTPVCDPMSKTCKGCVADSDCSGATPSCDTGTGVCVGCRTSADCAGPVPICAANKTCVACANDAECTTKDARFPACHTSGPLAGACTECSGANATKCKDARPECQVALGFCGCSDRDGDIECGGAMSGIVCNAPVGICVPGCATSAGRNGCPTGQTCNAQGTMIGACMIGGCTTDAMCAAPRPKCDTGVNPGSCVQCLMNNDCPAPYVCDATASKTCVECTTGNTGNCLANGAGTRCLGNNTCGCTMDSECGGARSGRVCDTGLTKCSPGCRGTGGNTCPIGFVCTSTDSTIGRCLPPGSTLDGGVDAGGADGGTDAAADGPVDAAGGAGDAPALVDAVADARTDMTVDAVVDAVAHDAQGPTADGGTDAVFGVDGYLAGGGCECAVGGERSGGRGLPLLLAPVAIVLGLRRRKRRR